MEGEKFTPGLLQEILSNLEKPVKNKKALLAALIERDDAGALQVLLDMKYVANTKIRDELIDLASSSGKTLSLAALLTYKERTGNRAKEEKAREKKLNRELNMPAEELHRKEMRKIWNFSFVSSETKSEYKINGYKGNDAVVEVPADIGGIPVTVISRRAFFGHSSLKEIKLPEGVTEIGRDSFRDCSSLEKIDLPESVKKIGEDAFMGCSSLHEIQLPNSVTKIGYGAFEARSLGYTNHLTIYAPAGSYAETYAKEYKIPFVAE